MPQSKLIELSYFDPKALVRLSAYADTIILDSNTSSQIIAAIRFGGYPEMVQAMSDAIYSGATIDAIQNGVTHQLQSIVKGYRRQISQDGIYAAATLMADDEAQVAVSQEEEDEDTGNPPPAEQPRKCYLFCPAGDRDRLFEELDRKTAAPLIPAFRDYMLDTLLSAGDLRQLQVISLQERMDAYVLQLLPADKNVVQALEQGLRDRSITIPGAVPGQPDGFAEVMNVTGYLNTFGITVADRIRSQFHPLFDPAAEPLSKEVLAINDHILCTAGYSLYDAQLAVAEAVKRQLIQRKIALIIAECGSGKSKIGSAAFGALYGLQAALQHRKKTFGLVMCPSHVTGKWVREIGETLPDTYGMVVRSISDLNRLYALYEAGDKNVYAIFSKERARDGYMRYPAVTWNQRKKAFLCPDCMEPVEMAISDSGTKYYVNADQFFFQTEHRGNRVCSRCGTMLWAPVNERRKIPWVKIGNYGWVWRCGAASHMLRTENEAVLDRLKVIAAHPDDHYPTAGAVRRFPLSTYIKKKMRGRVDSFLCDELHEYNNASGQGDAMGELFQVSKQFVGMTATLINGYSSGIFHLLYRIVPGLMRKDGKVYRRPSDFDAEYGVTEETYEIKDAEYNANRRTTRRKIKSRQLPGVSPLVFSRFLLEYAVFLSLSDMGKDLPDYEEIPIPLDMPEAVKESYQKTEKILQRILKTDPKAAKKLLSAYLNLLTVYPDQPYDHKPILHPVDGAVVVEPEDVGDFSTTLPKEEKVLEIARKKTAAGGRLLVYTSWTRTDSQQKILKLLRDNGIRSEILAPTIPPEKREAWVDKQLKSGLQVLITNPRCVETGLDLNAFTTLIFYSVGYNLFTLRQASRRSWRINQTAPRVEVYLLYYKDTLQAKAMKLMASKLAVAGIIEGSISEEGLAAMSDVKDLTSQMAKELALGIKDNVEDIASAFHKMAIINPHRGAKPTGDLLPAAAGVLILPENPQKKVAAVQTPNKIYEGLLERTMDEQKRKRSKKAVADQNQLSLFDPAA